MSKMRGSRGLTSTESVKEGRVFRKLGADGALFRLTALLAGAVAVAGLVLVVVAVVRWMGGPQPMEVQLTTRETLNLPGQLGVKDQSGAVRTFLWERPTQAAWGLHSAGQILNGLCLAAGAGAYVHFARAVNRGRPFGGAFRWAGGMGVIALVLGAWGGSFLRGAASMEFMGVHGDDVGRVLSAGGSALTVDAAHAVMAATEFPLWPVGAVLVLGLVDVAFTYGRMLEKDTEGMV